MKQKRPPALTKRSCKSSVFDCAAFAGMIFENPWYGIKEG
jgi:hypothetical protein